jgi:ABC-type glycerol-3-phosphate transport system substrate-binding protein
LQRRCFSKDWKFLPVFSNHWKRKASKFKTAGELRLIDLDSTGKHFRMQAMNCRFIYPLLIFIVCAGIGLSEESARRQLRWMGHWEDRGLREQLVHEVRDEFQFLHQDVDIEMAFPVEIMGERGKIITGKYIAEMIRSGRMDWDVVWMDPTIYQATAAELNDPDWGKKHLVDFSQFPDIKAAHQSFLVEGPDCHRGTGGVFVGPYIEGLYTYLWYNKTVADKLGLEIKEMEMSADDFLGYLERVKEYNRTAEVPVSACAIFGWPSSLGRLAYNLYLSEHLAHPEKPDDEILARILRFFESMSACDPLLNNMRVSNPEAFQHNAALIAEDKALFMIEPSWNYTNLARNFPNLMNKLRPAQLPGFEKQPFFVGGFIPTWAVMKNSPARDLGIDLMRFWCSPEIAQKWVRYAKSPTGLSGNLYDSEYGMDPFARFYKKLVSGRTIQTDVAFLKTEENPLFSIWDCLVPVIDGEMTADEVLLKLHKQADE